MTNQVSKPAIKWAYERASEQPAHAMAVRMMRWVLIVLVLPALLASCASSREAVDDYGSAALHGIGALTLIDLPSIPEKPVIAVPHFTKEGYDVSIVAGSGGGLLFSATYLIVEAAPRLDFRTGKPLEATDNYVIPIADSTGKSSNMIGNMEEGRLQSVALFRGHANPSSQNEEPLLAIATRTLDDRNKPSPVRIVVYELRPRLRYWQRGRTNILSTFVPVAEWQAARQYCDASDALRRVFALSVNRTHDCELSK
jgi:hypothetical protein